MKKALIKALTWIGLILFCTGIALAQEIIPLFGAPKAPVTVINATTDHVPLVAIDTSNNRTVVVEPGVPGKINIEYFSMQGDAFFAINACSSTRMVNHFNNPPDWTMDTEKFPGVALTQEFFDSQPKTKDLEARIDGIKRILHGQLGEKDKKTELNAWFRPVKRHGISTEIVKCENTFPIPARIASATLFNNTGSQTTVTISGDRAHGYYVVYGQYIN